MRKNNEGYVLAMVMAVIAVLAVVASTMLSVGLRNVMTQQTAVARMQAKYEAEGAIEQVVAEFGEVKAENCTTEETAKTNFATQMGSILERYNPTNPDETLDNTHRDLEVTKLSTQEEEKNGTYKYRVVSKRKYTVATEDSSTTAPIVVSCEIEFTRKISPTKNSVSHYDATVGSIQYTSYEKSTTTEGGEDG